MMMDPTTVTQLLLTAHLSQLLFILRSTNLSQITRPVKLPGFFEDTDYGRFSQLSNFSSRSDSSLSWGEDNFEGEATRQVALLFEQIDDLLYEENKSNFISFPVVPLPRNSKKVNRGVAKTKGKTSAAAEIVPHSNKRHVNHVHEGQSISKHVKVKPKQSLNLKENRLENNEDSDSGDEVVWETLSKSNKNGTIANHKTDIPISRSSKTRKSQKKLSTIAEQVPNKTVKSNESHEGNTDILVPELETDISDNISRENSKSGSSEEAGRQRLDTNSSEDDSYISNSTQEEEVLDVVSTPSHAVLQMDDISFRGGIYDMVFSGNSSVKVTSPLLLPTPTTPAGVPLEPTKLMRDESSHWSKRFPHLRVRGHAVDTELLLAMEEYAFLKFSLVNKKLKQSNADVNEQNNYGNKDEQLENNETIMSHGYYDNQSNDLCLVGSYLPSPLSSQSNKLRDSIENTRGGNKKGLYKGSRICSGSEDPDILKEQVLLTLFDRVWLHVINVVGGLVQRYSAHLLALTNSISSSTTSASSVHVMPPLSREGVNTVLPTPPPSAPHYPSIQPGFLPSTASEVDYWRRPNTCDVPPFSSRRKSSDVNSALMRLQLREGQESAHRRHYDHPNIQEEMANDVTVTSLQSSSSSSSLLHSRLLTARTLMQITKAPLSPVSSRDDYVVSLPSLDIHQSNRPLSSISTLTTARNSSARNRFTSLTLDIENATSNSPLTPSSYSPSPFANNDLDSGPLSASTFLPPITKTGASSVPPLEVYNLFTPKEAKHPGTTKLRRRNSDTMAKVRVLPSLR